MKTNELIVNKELPKELPTYCTQCGNMLKATTVIYRYTADTGIPLRRYTLRCVKYSLFSSLFHDIRIFREEVRDEFIRVMEYYDNGY